MLCSDPKFVKVAYYCFSGSRCCIYQEVVNIWTGCLFRNSNLAEDCFMLLCPHICSTLFSELVYCNAPSWLMTYILNTTLTLLTIWSITIPPIVNCLPCTAFVPLHRTSSIAWMRLVQLHVLMSNFEVHPVSTISFALRPFTIRSNCSNASMAIVALHCLFTRGQHHVTHNGRPWGV